MSLLIVFNLILIFVIMIIRCIKKRITKCQWLLFYTLLFLFNGYYIINQRKNITNEHFTADVHDLDKLDDNINTIDRSKVVRNDEIIVGNEIIDKVSKPEKRLFQDDTETPLGDTRKIKIDDEQMQRVYMDTGEDNVMNTRIMKVPEYNITNVNSFYDSITRQFPNRNCKENMKSRYMNDTCVPKW